MSKIKTDQYKAGTVKVKFNKISKQEKAVATHLLTIGVDYEPQFHIPGLPYYYDFLLTNTNTIVEYQGDYWHANPLKYAPDRMLKIQNRGEVPVSQIWEADRLKKEAAEAAGYRVIYFWEADLKRNGVEFIEHLIHESQTNK